jgi:hypothetical protein
MKNLKAMELTRVLAYSELLTTITDDLTKFGQMVYQCFLDGGIQQFEAERIHEDLAKEIDEIEKSRIELAKELTRRVKHDLGLRKGPGDYDNLLNGYLQKHRMIGRSKEEIDMFEKEAEHNKDLMKDKK